MRFYILTLEERQAIEDWLDGKEIDSIRTIAYRGRKYLPQLQGDVKLLVRFLVKYGAFKKEDSN